MPEARVMTICASVLLAWCCSADPAQATLGRPKTVFMIGNSFTHNAEPYSIPAIAAQKSDALTVGAHIKSGSPVHNIWGSPDNAREISKAFGKYRDALTKHPWDVVTLQPFYKKPGEGFPQSTMQSDIDSILKFIELARENPANKKTKFYIYASWPFLWTGKPFQQAWDSTTKDELTAPTLHTRDYYEYLLKRLKVKTDAEIHLIPVPEVIYQLDRQMQAGKVPGLTGIGDLMKDKLHLDPGLGHYIASVTVYATLFGKNPGGLVKPEGHYDDGNKELLTPQMCEIVNKTVWDVVSKNPATGVGAAADSDNAKPIDWRKLMTVAEVKRETGGNLLPLQSYDETIRRGMDFLLKDHLKWFKGPTESTVDEKGQMQMPWVYYSNLQHNGAPFPNSVDRFVSYPAFHHALMIRMFIGYSKYAGDKQALAEAVKLADWNIAHSTPADWPYGGLPWSTFEAKKPGGFRDKSGLMPDKAAIMGLAYIQLCEATGEARFLKAAEAIAATLAARQRPEGTWPFRVDPKTEAVIEEYTSSMIYAVRLFESLDKRNGNNRYRAHRDKAWNWLVNGPIKTKEFRGFYEDIPASKDGRTNYDCLDTIRYLLANRTDANGYLEMAKDLNAWVEKTFMDKIKGFEPAEGIREQLQCNVVMGIHSLNWASMLLDLARATGDEKLRKRAIQTANYITYYLQPDNRIVVGFEYKQWWYSCHAGVIFYLLDFDDASANRDEPRL